MPTFDPEPSRRPGALAIGAVLLVCVAAGGFAAYRLLRPAEGASAAGGGASSGVVGTASRDGLGGSPGAEGSASGSAPGGPAQHLAGSSTQNAPPLTNEASAAPGGSQGSSAGTGARSARSAPPMPPPPPSGAVPTEAEAARYAAAANYAPLPTVHYGSGASGGAAASAAGAQGSQPAANTAGAGYRNEQANQAYANQTAANPPPHESGSGSTNQTPTPEPDPSSDRTPPSIQGLRFDPPQITDGAITNAIIMVSDDLSGCKTVTGSLRSPSGAAVIPFESQTDPSGTMFSAKLTIPSKAETGAWYIATLYLLDKAGNSQIASFTPQTVPPGGTVQVTSAESDSTPPTVTDITLDKNSVRDGERNLIRIRADDDRSGVETLWGTFQSASKTALIGFSCHANADSGLWEGDVPVPQNADCGEWTLIQLRVTDKAGNLLVMQSDTPQMPRVAFEVVGDGNCDSSAPTLESFTLSPTVVSNENASEISVSAIVRDIGTGATSVSGWVSGPVDAHGQAPRLQFSCVPAPNDPEAPWSGKILMPKFSAKGVWKVILVRLFDRAHNLRDYTPGDPVLSGGSYEVQ